MIKLTSPAFENGGEIPKRFTCYGVDVNPRLEWDKVPENTESLTILMENWDKKKGNFVHWVLYDIPADIQRIPEGLPIGAILDFGAKQAINDHGAYGYSGPCPRNESGTCIFRILACKYPITLPGRVSSWEVERFLDGTTIDTGELEGHFAY